MLHAVATPAVDLPTHRPTDHRTTLPAVTLPPDPRCTAPSDLVGWGREKQSAVRRALAPQADALMGPGQHEALARAADDEQRALDSAEALQALEGAFGSAREQFFDVNQYDTNLLTSDDIAQ